MNNIDVQRCISFRHLLHANPELSGKEFNSKKLIIEHLSVHSKASIIEVANTGVLAIFEGLESGPTILIRSEIDALPIEELNTLTYRSKVQGVSHSCGHDGHSAILIGVATFLSEKKLKKGKLLLLFQPAEEDGSGAAEVLKDAFFKNISIDFVFALHNLPGFNKHEIVIKKNEFTAEVKSMIVKLQGKTAHAAEPEKGYNPGIAISEIIQFADKLTHNYAGSDNFFLLTLIHISAGELAYGVSAGYGEVHLTARSWSPELMNEKCSYLVQFIEDCCNKHKLSYSISWTQEFSANINHEEAVNIITKAGKESQLKILNIDTPFKWGEDFGMFTQKYKGAMFGLGAGQETPALHNPDYDFPDDLIPTGVHVFQKIIEQILNN